MISLSDKMLYKTGDYNVLPAAQDVLGKVAQVVNDYDTYSVLIEGNTDNVPLNSGNLPKDNWDLSALRATSVAADEIWGQSFQNYCRRPLRV